MDISELIKSYNAEQKNVFTGFCIQLPLCFSILYLYIPEFKSLDVYLQIIYMVMSMFFYIKKKIQTRSLYTNSSHISDIF